MKQPLLRGPFAYLTRHPKMIFQVVALWILKLGILGFHFSYCFPSKFSGLRYDRQSHALGSEQYK